MARRVSCWQQDLKLDAPKIEVWMGELVGALIHEGVIAPAIIQVTTGTRLASGGASPCLEWLLVLWAC